MSQFKQIPPPRDGGDRPLPAEYQGQAPVPAYPADPYPMYEPEPEALDWRRYVVGVLRYKWLLLVALLVAAAGTIVVWRVVPVTYVTRGNLWVEPEGGPGPQPIRPPGVLGQNQTALELLRSYSVLDSVVVHERLYLQAPGEYGEAFADFSVPESFVPGTFELRVDAEGDEFVLMTEAGVEVDAGRFGESVGESLGHAWTPPVGMFPAGEVVRYTVLRPRDAAQQLSSGIGTIMSGQSNFLGIVMEGTDPRRIATTVNALMERYVIVAADLKRARLDETLLILEEQLQYTEDSLQAAERALEEFRVATISLPSDRLAPIAAGLQLTRDPVFGSFFDQRIEIDQVRRDRDRLQTVLEEINRTGVVRIEALELIPLVRESSELTRALSELVEARSELRVLRDRYSDDYPPLQDLLASIESIERGTVPNIVQGVIRQLNDTETSLDARITETTGELQAIPPRTIDEARLQRTVNITETLYNELRSRVETARLAAASSIPDVRILDRAQVPDEPTQDERLRLVFMLFAGCLGAAVGGALLLDRTDARYRYATDVSRDIGLGILGSIPRIHGGQGKQGVLNAAQALEAFRELRIHVGFAYGSAGPITLTISSPAAGEGKSLISSNLAVAFSEVGQRTLLIDGDTRRGDSHRLFGLEQSPGLTDYLKDRTGQEIIQQTGHENLDFIGCGTRGTSTPELLASNRMAQLMGTLKRSYDVIIVDSPPLASGGDPLILSTLTGNLAVVIRTGSTDKQLTHAKLEQLNRLPVRVLGAILNDVDPADGYHYYYASYLPGYEPVPEDGEEEVELISDGKG
jgi:capsular exopolysaccharide synthesis family protein